jgi:hypothetical protein
MLQHWKACDMIPGYCWSGFWNRCNQLQARQIVFNYERGAVDGVHRTAYRFVVLQKLVVGLNGFTGWSQLPLIWFVGIVFQHLTLGLLWLVNFVIVDFYQTIKFKLFVCINADKLGAQMIYLWWPRLSMEFGAQVIYLWWPRLSMERHSKGGKYWLCEGRFKMLILQLAWFSNFLPRYLWNGSDEDSKIL